MKKKLNLTKDDFEKMEANGFTSNSGLARLLRVSRQTIARYRKAVKAPMATGITESRNKKIYDLYNSLGVKPSVIAEKYNISKARVFQILESMKG